MSRQSKRCTHVVVLAVLLIAGVTAGVPARAQIAVEPQIALLNPSGFASAGERGITVSDQRPDAGPACCDLADDFYRLSAWVADAPDGSSVFFTVRQSALEFEIGSNQETSSGAWVAEWDIPPDLLDGPATVSAFLVANDEVLASTSQSVTIMRSQDNVDVTWPRPGDRFGTYSALGTSMPAEGVASIKDPAGVVDVLFTDSPQISYVRSFYTTSVAGTQPEWKVCGTETVTASNAGNGMRCTVDPADDGKVTAVAAVPNSSPDEYEARFNGSGDAIPVVENYTQVPTTLGLGGAVGQNVGKETNSDRFFCSDNQEVRLTDQFGRGIPGANVDVHAAGPSDGLAFHTFSVLTVNQPPDRGDHRLETAFDCTGQSATLPPSNANPSQQAEHQRFGAPDRKHIETRASGTNDFGVFSFRFHSNAAGVTSYTAWLDEFDDGCHANDDRFTTGEMSVSGTVGWSIQPGSPEIQPFETFVPCLDGEPLPEPEPEPEPSGQRTISLKWNKKASTGNRVAVKGRISAAEDQCTSLQHVVLKARRPGRSFKTIDETVTSDSGLYRFKVRTSRDLDLKAIAVERGFCLRARSAVLKIRSA